jgi:hypothetical protein
MKTLPLNRLTVLVADDDPDDRYLIMQAFKGSYLPGSETAGKILSE